MKEKMQEGSQKILRLVLGVLLVGAMGGSLSCEKVIDIDLNAAAPHYVIEAEVLADTNMAWVRISQTKNFDEDNNFTTVSGATVVVSDSSGRRDTLLQANDGRYISNALRGEQGKTYMLSVSVDGKVFTSTCSMPYRVSLDSVTFTTASAGGPGPGGGRGSKSLVPVYTDPVDKENYYRFIITNPLQPNEERTALRNDENTNGKVNERSISLRDINADNGTMLMVEMQCLSKDAYRFFSTLNERGGALNQSATPANPETNIQGGALGYFSVHTRQLLQVVVR